MKNSFDFNSLNAKIEGVFALLDPEPLSDA